MVSAAAASFCCLQGECRAESLLSVCYDFVLESMETQLSLGG